MISAPSPPPSPASPLPSAKVSVNRRLVLIPPQQPHHHRAENDDENPVSREIAAEERKLAFQIIGQNHRLLERSVNEARHRHRDENQADREQHLLEVARRVEPGVKQPLEDHAAGGDERECEREGEREGHAETRDRRGEDVAPGHGEHPVGEIGEPHQAHRHRQADRDHVQDHPQRGAVKGDADERCEEGLQFRILGELLSFAHEHLPRRRTPPCGRCYDSRSSEEITCFSNVASNG